MKITKQKVQAVAGLKAGCTLGHADVAILNELARIALASLEAEVAGFIVRHKGTGNFGSWLHSKADWFKSDEYEVLRAYTAPPAPVSVPDEDLLHMAASAIEDLLSNKDRYCAGVWADIPAKLRRAAMLQGAENAESRCTIQTAPVLDSLPKIAESRCSNSLVIPDDVRRMDWLVSKTVDVREPMVYGSHSLFWSQTITDEEGDYHATKLREQIDAAMEAEQAAALQQEVKP